MGFVRGRCLRGRFHMDSPGEDLGVSWRRSFRWLAALSPRNRWPAGFYVSRGTRNLLAGLPPLGLGRDCLSMGSSLGARSPTPFPYEAAGRIVEAVPQVAGVSGPSRSRWPAASCVFAWKPNVLAGLPAVRSEQGLPVDGIVRGARPPDAAPIRADRRIPGPFQRRVPAGNGIAWPPQIPWRPSSCRSGTGVFWPV
jgi:hypothetical protein